MCAVAIEHASLHTFNRIVRLTSFGFRYGIPHGERADLLIDARYLPFQRLKYPLLDRESIHGLKPLDVLDTIYRRMDGLDFFETEVRVNIGCDIGQLRSVKIVEWLAERCWRDKWIVQARHRDLIQGGRHI